MRVFISWSGTRSRHVAGALAEWIPYIVNAAEPWMSEAIEPGERWEDAIAGGLEAASVGVICVTPENQAAPWLNFEAGAIAKHVKSGRPVPFLFDLKKTDLTGPLAQFQAVVADAAGTLAMMAALGEQAEPQVVGEHLKHVVDKFWPELEAKLQAAPEPERENRSRKQRPREEKIDEILTIVRGLRRAEGAQWSSSELRALFSREFGERQEDLDRRMMDAEGRALLRERRFRPFVVKTLGEGVSAILRADVDGFTVRVRGEPTAERLRPDELTSRLNEAFGEVVMGDPSTRVVVEDTYKRRLLTPGEGKDATDGDS